MSRTQINSSLVPSSAISVQNIPNIVDNAGFEIWQRGSGPFSTPSVGTVYTCDRWATYFSGSSYTLTVSKETSIIDVIGTASMKVVTTLVSPDFAAVVYRMDGVENYRGQTLTFTIRCRTNISGMCRMSVQGNITGAVNSSFHTGGNTFETLTVTITLATNETGLSIFLNCGQASNVGTSYWDNCMGVTGSTATSFVPGNPQQDLARCQRFFWRIGQTNGVLDVGVSYSIGHAYTTTLSYGYIQLPVTMRVAPTVTFVNPTLMQVHNASGGNIATTSMVGLGNARYMQWTATVSGGLVAGNATALETQNTSSAPIDVSADL